MFTQQSGQIENALRGAGVPDISAKEMLQGVANCHAPLEHRGPVAFTRNPRDNRNLFPGVAPAGSTPGFYVPPSILNRPVFVNIPPWQNVPWTPIPYPEQSRWRPIPYPDWPGGQYPFDDVGVIISSPTYAGPITTPSMTAEQVTSSEIRNAGDIINQGGFVNQGPATINGPVEHNHNVVNRHGVTNKRTVINEGDVINEGSVHNEVAYNYNTANFGETNNYGPTTVNQFFSSGPSEFAGDTYIDGDSLNVTTTSVTIDGDDIDITGVTINLGDSNTTDVTIEGAQITLNGDVIVLGDGGPIGPLAGVTVDLVTDVVWDGSTLTKKYRTVSFLGAVAAEQEDAILTGTACPSTPVNAAAGNYVDMP